MSDIIQTRRGTAAEWTLADTILADGEQGFETDTLKMKIGDGVTAWTSLTYFISGGVAGITELSDLTDVNTSTPTNRNVLVADGLDFESRALVEADISDLDTYLTAETNDLSSVVTWANVPDANITETSVTQHQTALSVTKSQISDFTESDYATGAEGDLATSALQDITAESINDLDDVNITALGDGNLLQWNLSTGDWENVTSTSVGVTDHTALSNIGTNSHALIDTAITNSTNHIADATLHFTEGSISITESQISDLQSYSLDTHVHEGTEIDATAVTDGYVLTADGAGNSVWEVPDTGALTLDELTDVTITAPAADDVIAWTGAAWVNTQIVPAPLADLTDTTITAVTTDEILIWDGAAWINNTFAEANIAAGDHEHEGVEINSSAITVGKVLTSDGAGNCTWEVNETGVTDHGDLTSIGTNSHAALDINYTNSVNHIADGTIHFTEGSISITESQISDFGSYSPDTHVHEGTDIDSTAEAADLILTSDGAGNATWEVGAAGDLEGLSDTTITSVTSGELLKWTGAAWENNTLAEANIATAGHTHEGTAIDSTAEITGKVLTSDGAGNCTWEATTLDGLGDVVLTGIASDDVIAWNGIAWVNTQIVPDSITTLTDVNITGLVTGQRLQWDGADWVNVEPNIVQTIHGTISAQTGTTEIPYDSTTPLISEGTQIGTADFTMTKAAHDVHIQFNILIEGSTNNADVVVAVFRDTICVASYPVGTNTSGSSLPVSFHFVDNPADTATHTYSGRIGISAGTWLVNSPSGGNLGGTVVGGSQFTLSERA